MTVKDLMNNLSKCNPDAKVFIEVTETCSGSSWTGSWEEEYFVDDFDVHDLEEKIHIVPNKQA
jgi:hypothetical protein